MLTKITQVIDNMITRVIYLKGGDVSGVGKTGDECTMMNVI